MSTDPEHQGPVRITVQVSDQESRQRSRRLRKDLHAPCPDQLVLFDPHTTEDQP